MVADILGEGVLMYASDYPHGESAFPESTNIIFGWNNMPEQRKRKLFWDNPMRFYARCGLHRLARRIDHPSTSGRKRGGWCLNGIDEFLTRSRPGDSVFCQREDNPLTRSRT